MRYLRQGLPGAKTSRSPTANRFGTTNASSATMPGVVSAEAIQYGKNTEKYPATTNRRFN